MSSDETTRFILQVLAVFLGGGTVQLVLRLVFRRSELRKVSSESDSVVVTSANNQVLRLEKEVERQAAELVKVRDELEKERASRDRQLAEIRRHYERNLAETQRQATSSLEEFRQENSNLNRLVNKLSLDLSRANAEIAILQEVQSHGKT